MKTIFIDVGGHLGQTLEEVTKSYYNFDSVYCFEPMYSEYEHLVKVYNDVAIILPYGLLDYTGNMKLYGLNENMTSSIYANKNDLINSDSVTESYAVDVSLWIEHNTDPDDIIIMKLNCEGSEVIILNRLVDNNLINRFNNIMIDFDILKVPGEEHQALNTIERIKASGFKSYSLAQEL